MSIPTVLNVYCLEWVVQGPLTWLISLINVVLNLVMARVYFPWPKPSTANLYGVLISINGIVGTIFLQRYFLGEKLHVTWDAPHIIRDLRVFGLGSVRFTKIKKR